MGFFELLVFAIGVSMDALAVSICKGLSMRKATWKAGFTCGLWFGGFQALMPLIGFFLGKFFSQATFIQQVDHWIAFILLAFIGGNMLKEAFEKGCDCENCTADLSFKTMLTMAIATSIDALTLGVSPLGTEPNTNIWVAVSLIGVITCIVCTVGLKLSNFLGSRFEKKAQFMGGAILVAFGIFMLVKGLLE